MDKAAVLLLERSASVIDVVREALAGEVDLHVTNSIDLALRVVERRRPAVVVLDTTMVGGSPGELVMKMRAAHPAVRIVFISEAGELFDRRHAQLGALLPKPFTAEKFAEVIRSAMRFQSMSAGVQRMRHQSGTYRAVELHEPMTQVARRASSRPPPMPATGVSSSPPPTAGPTITEGSTRPPRARNLTPPPIPRDETNARPRTQPPPPMPREEPPRARNLTPPPLREEPPPRARNLTPPPIPREEPPRARPRSPSSAPPPGLREDPASEPPPPFARGR